MKLPIYLTLAFANLAKFASAVVPQELVNIKLAIASVDTVVKATNTIVVNDIKTTVDQLYDKTDGIGATVSKVDKSIVAVVGKVDTQFNKTYEIGATVGTMDNKIDQLLSLLQDVKDLLDDCCAGDVI